MNEIRPDKLVLYDKLIASNPKIERKGATVAYKVPNVAGITFPES